MPNYEVTLSDGSIHTILANDPIEAKYLTEKLYEEEEFTGLNAPYRVFNTAPFVLNVEVPDSMEHETISALKNLKKAVGGDIRRFVIDRLKYDTYREMDACFSAEQLDSIALAIYNIEAKSQGMIIGDQTGIGKGRQAAAIVRYGIVNGYKPIFLTEKANLFSDLLRDLIDIKSDNYKPFIVNAKSSDTDMRNAQDKVIYKSLPSADKNKAFDKRKLPAGFDYVVATYSQFNTPSDWLTKGKSPKQQFLSKIGEKNIFIMDESHNTSGNSGIGLLLRSILREAKGCVFLSATFAKRPDNMPIYSSKTAMSDANLDSDKLTEAIEKGGVALQEVISSQLVQEGQMIRRQRTFEGVEVNYIALTDNKQLHYSACNTLTSIMRDIVEFQKEFVTPAIKELDNAVKTTGSDVTQRKGTAKAGVNNSPYFSKLFNVINQMLFTLKAEDVAKQTIKRLQDGMSVVVAFGNTMESFYNEYNLEEVIDCDFSEVLKRGLDSVLKTTTTDIMGEKTHDYLNPEELGVEVYDRYTEILEAIEKASVGFSASPVDVVTKIITEAGYKVGEVTGRSRYIKLDKSLTKGQILNRKKEPRKTTFQKFQDNEYDVLLINQAGSTGASAHAIPTSKVPKGKVKKRCMIVLQAELDINKEVQKRGRIHRTGQIYKPIYDYMNSEIPAEKRLVMMLKSKLKSLDANTSSDQKNSEAILESPDFLNQIGDKIAFNWLKENPEINTKLDNPLKFGDDKGKDASQEKVKGSALKVSGRIAILDTEDQERFYTEILERYTAEVNRLKAIDEYNLEMSDLNLQAETKSKNIFIGGKNSHSSFGGDTFIERVTANNLKKPLSKSKIELMLNDFIKDKTAIEVQTELINKITEYYKTEFVNLKERLQVELKEALAKGSESAIYKKLVKENKDNSNFDAAKEYDLFIRKAYQDKETNLINKLESVKNHVLVAFESLKSGQSINYGPHHNSVRGIFIGFEVTPSTKGNPFAPSRVKAIITTASPHRTITLPLSGDTGNEVRSIGASARFVRTDYLNGWDEYTKLMSSDRHTRYILTGNLLQAVGSVENGNLVNYTLKNGGTTKGLLLPLGYDASNFKESNFVSVPATKGISVVKSLTGMLSLNGKDAYFYKHNDMLMFSVPASAKRGAEFYKNPEILKYVSGNSFSSISSRMEARVSDLEKLLQVLEEMGISVNMSRVSYIEKFGEPTNNSSNFVWKKLKLKNPSKTYEPKPDKSLEKAKAIAIALKLKIKLIKLKQAA